jgi:uncharacterized RDD family membrane protein YckC
MSSTDPPPGSTPPPDEPTKPPPPPPPAGEAGGTYPPPPASYGAYPPPPPPAGGPAPMGGYPGAAYGPGQPGNLLDRFLARLIDGIIVGIALLVINIVLQASMSYFSAVFVSGVVGAALYLGYFAVMESSRGQTLGKQVMRLRTLAPDGQSNPTIDEALKRNIYYAFAAVPCLGALAELISVILIAVNISSDPQRQHLFDRFAGGTKVLKV